MREVSEREQWDKLAKASQARKFPTIALSAGLELELSRGCIVVAGWNGAGKSEVLLEANKQLGETSILIQLHQLCEQVRAVHMSRDDIAEMEAEIGPLPVDEKVLGHVRRVVGRDYDSVEWFALDVGPTNEQDSVFMWGGEQPLVPHFRVVHRGTEYSTLRMGLGELSVHLLFWVLEQYRDRSNVTLLLDEPDAYLPPIGSERILARLQAVCLKRGWSLVVSTHSEEMILAACENEGLLLVRRGDASAIEGVASWANGPDIAAELLSDPPVELVLFCEDESAAALTRTLLTSC